MVLHLGYVTKQSNGSRIIQQSKAVYCMMKKKELLHLNGVSVHLLVCSLQCSIPTVLRTGTGTVTNILVVYAETSVSATHMTLLNEEQTKKLQEGLQLLSSALSFQAGPSSRQNGRLGCTVD